jgi:hypothetical protein
LCLAQQGRDIRSVQASEILLSGKVSQTRIPLNHLLEFKLVLSWKGGADKFTVIQFEDPALTNFEITGTATQRLSESVSGEIRNTTEYVYTLRPLEIGMAYIDQAYVKIRNHAFDREEAMTTRRIPVEILAPLPEEEKGALNPFFSLAILVTAGGICSVFYLLIKKKRSREKDAVVSAEPPESRFLEQLRAGVNLDHPDLNGDFARLSRLVRGYLSEKFSIGALKSTADELRLQLERTGMESNQIRSLNEILVRSDEIKFSGTEGTREELTRFFTLIEGILEAFKAKEWPLNTGKRNQEEE